MTIVNHSNRQPIGSKLIVFLDEVPNIKTKYGDWKKKEDDLLLIGNEQRLVMAERATTGIIMVMGDQCFKDISESEKPRVGDRVTFTSYSGLPKYEGDMCYRSLKDEEIHDWYIPQREKINSEQPN